MLKKKRTESLMFNGTVIIIISIIIKLNTLLTQRNQLSMCNITRKQQTFDIREKRGAMRKRIQIEMNSPIHQKLFFESNLLSSPRKLSDD